MRAEEQARLALNELVAEARSCQRKSSTKRRIEFEESDESRARAADAPTQPGFAEPAPEVPPRRPKKPQEKEDLQPCKGPASTCCSKSSSPNTASADRGMEIRQIAGGYRMATKPEHHDVVVNFAKSLKPPVRLSLQALETLSVIAYKQPVTVPEISEIRGVDSSGVIATLLDRKLITTAGRKQVIGRPILYKTTKEFLLRFGLNDVAELPSMEEFEKLGDPQSELFQAPAGPKRRQHPTEMSEDEPVTEADPALVKPENSNEGRARVHSNCRSGPARAPHEAIAPVAGVEQGSRSVRLGARTNCRSLGSPFDFAQGALGMTPLARIDGLRTRSCPNPAP